MECCLIYMTAASADEAKRLGATLVEEQLVACANVIDGMQSIYRWEGEIRTDCEAVLIAKTPAALVEAVVARVRDLHSYSCPCIVALPIAGGNPAFLRWIGDETRKV